ncbi:MAG: hypothetical protein FJW23_09725 [Acidimicrobiia bacterium]|nr:hypothetical protein [Acidimicrobiia bacterium]
MPDTAPQAAQEPPSLRTVALATATAFVLAAVILVTAVLPAEYGVDPLGTGAAFGLSALADTRPGVVAPATGSYRSDSAVFVLRPFEWIEYKYRLEEGAGMLFAWEATVPVRYDLHGEPNAGPEYAESFESADRQEGRGTFRAPFTGIHGWYWQNRTTSEVTIRLWTTGFYTAIHEFFEGGSTSRTLDDDRASGGDGS